MFNSFMKIAIAEAKIAAKFGEIPVGAVIVDSKKRILARAHNEVQKSKDPCAHAEIIVIREACMLTGSKYLNGCSIYTTLEPCAMCAAAISLSRIDSLYYGLNDPKSGAVEAGPQIFFHPQTHHKPTVYAGFLEDEIAELMKTFFWALRKKKKNDNYSQKKI
ncbi:MAG: nucleoside deaminase [Pseudomonadota bacterium]|nr:nucleoside deaminase [Pseudomonadota bacterium]